MRSTTSLRVSLVILVMSLFSTLFFGHGYYKNVYLPGRSLAKNPFMIVPHNYMASAPMWTHGLWISAAVAVALIVVTVFLLVRRNVTN